MTEDKDEERRSGGQPRSKVARVIDSYDLGIGDELERRWLATDERGMSLRELATYVNREILEAAIEQSERSVLDVDVESVYERLTSDDVSEGVRTRSRRRLERNGVESRQSRATS
ncbi:hypothetical protein HLRTI_003134 [Halorhabdus tiamatea SARL4B]|uniref:Uncharacterized protein n=1 Tax=Halorhabdus tiamatea SARL4B TaxID=1033806 RepID=U2DXH3_9EURY|nr:rod-determining factor RdfA [Halorhabdus tiamatea]ERJ04903.1 hypothetical protein HLRTI_003134 [Halorhabdus tiamatea SARL4B]